LQIAVADKDSDSCLKLRLRIAPSLAFLLAPQVSNHQILKTLVDQLPTTNIDLKPITKFMQYWMLSVPLLIGTFNGLLSAIMLFMRGREDDRLSDWMLAMVLVGLCFLMIDFTVGYMGINIFWSGGFWSGFPREFGFMFGIGPLIFLYLNSVTNTEFKMTRKYWLLMLPQLITFGVSLLIWSEHGTISAAWSQLQSKYHIGEVLFWLSILSQYYFLYKSLKLFEGYSQWIKQEYSYAEQIGLKWFRNFLYGWGLIITMHWINSLQLHFSGYNFTAAGWFYYLEAAFTIYVSVLGYLQYHPVQSVQYEMGIERDINKGTLTNIDFLATNVDLSSNLHQLPIQEEKSQQTTNFDLAFWKEKVENIMVLKKPYLESELSLTDLSKMLSTNPSLLSGVINSGFGKNFNDFVNDYRIEVVKDKLNSGEAVSKTLLGIAYESGFNSKATFNRSFKKNTGLSPKEFIEKNK
jgi:AraC-like DNA-binding protein